MVVERGGGKRWWKEVKSGEDDEGGGRWWKVVRIVKMVESGEDARTW